MAGALAICAFLGAGAEAEALPLSGQVSFSVAGLSPSFSPRIHDYVVRCNNAPVTVKVHASGAWRAAIGSERFRRGDFRETVPLSAGRAFRITYKRRRHAHRYRYHVRCLPDDFPTYSFTHHGAVSPRYFSVSQAFHIPDASRYAIIFDNHGVPIWWDHAPALDPRVLQDGTVLWFDYSLKQFEVHRLDGSLVRTLDAVGQQADLHDLQLLDSGDYLVGAYVTQSHVDTSAYGGSSDADVKNAELQQVSPEGNVVWDWKSQDHISLAETGRWWQDAITWWRYDIVHWNSIEPDGGSVIASFRHLDAVYKIRKSTGRIVWKLGGTPTPESLEVKHDPYHHTFGGQHDARLLPDGTLTVLDNRTVLTNHTPRAVRYRINQRRRTARLVQSITDPAVSVSNCCGSARRLGNGDWLIDWGGFHNNPIGGYKPDGQRTFLLTLTVSSDSSQPNRAAVPAPLPRFDTNFSYRAEPVPSGVVSPRDLREGMRAMYAGAHLSGGP